MTTVNRNNRTSHTTRPGGGTTIRPMYGVFIRDQVATFRSQIQQTLDDTKRAIAAGDPKAKAIPGDFKLEGTEVTKAKKAVKDLEKAIKALKPVFANTGPGTSSGATRPGRPAAGNGGMIAMYGIVFRDDLTAYRTEVNKNLMDIRAAINNGSLKGEAKAEAQKAVKYLESAVKDLGSAASNWR